jgi:catechol 2,3-dioxygenase-like lactoylglutathione lyase family enzyme
MLGQFPLLPSIPASDMARAKAYYQDTLGLSVLREMADGGIFFKSGNAEFLVYPSPAAGSNQATAAGWHVQDLETAVGELKTKGVKFEDYDFDELKTENGIATMADGQKAAWFKDTEGNILAIFQLT